MSLAIAPMKHSTSERREGAHLWRPGQWLSNCGEPVGCFCEEVQGPGDYTPDDAPGFINVILPTLWGRLCLLATVQVYSIDLYHDS